MIKTNKGSLKVIGRKDEIGADICFIISEMVERGVFTFEEIERILKLAKKTINNERW